MSDDKLYNKIKNAEQNAETHDFPGMDKVWNRVGEKLDAKVLQKQNSKWKNFAIAASVLLVVSLGFLLNNENEGSVNADEQVVVTDTTSTLRVDDDTRIVSSEITNPKIKEDATEILKKQLAPTAKAVASQEMTDEIMAEPATDVVVAETANKITHSASNYYKTTLKSVTEARIVVRSADTFDISAQEVVSKPKPLLVLDGVALKEGKKYEKSLGNALNKIESGDDEILLLTNPLYIINGNYYSEQQMFGENATSPYAPLTKQDIETLTILQGEKAISIYGERGKNGVVLITTKGGKPASTEK